MGKQLKRSKSNSATKRPRSKLVLGSFGNACVEDCFDSSKSCFKSVVSSLKDADFDLSDNFYSDEEDLSIVHAVSPLMVSESHSLRAACVLSDGFHGTHSANCQNRLP